MRRPVIPGELSPTVEAQPGVWSPEPPKDGRDTQPEQHLPTYRPTKPSNQPLPEYGAVQFPEEKEN
ncbi:hypothetical protein VTJ04DRAFT_4730 [Mycothermus thermophilus]|uniref:uncharacterized protein n=1 Tax=Humicola insolens TaxID=85995 RepID=UPI0037446491